VQNLPVRFVIDRAGFVGADGPTHNGSFDIAFLRILPNFIIMAPSNATELVAMIKTMHGINNAPSAIRYPKKEVDIENIININQAEIIPIGKAKIIQNGKQIAIISYGTTLNIANTAAQQITTKTQIVPYVIDARFAKPLDIDLFTKIFQECSTIITVEDGSIGGFGSAICELAATKLYKGNLHNICHSDTFLPHNTVANLYNICGITAENICNIAIQYYT
jgi:1-deoxy-D-xylulose-5-phosphate synthase